MKNLSQPLLRIFLILAVIFLLALSWQTVRTFLDNQSDPAASETESAAGLTIDIRDEEVVTDPVLTVTGSGTPGRQVLVNGQPVPLDAAGRYEISLRLVEGPNLVLVESVDETGSVTSLSRQVIYSADGTVPQIEEPPPSPATASWLLGLAVLVIFTAALFALARRGKPWVNVTTGATHLHPGPKSTGDTLPIIIELDRTTSLTLTVETEKGERLTTLLNNRRRKAGRHTFHWDGYTLDGEKTPAGVVRIVCEAGILFSKTKAQAEIRIIQ